MTEDRRRRRRGRPSRDPVVEPQPRMRLPRVLHGYHFIKHTGCWVEIFYSRHGCEPRGWHFWHCQPGDLPSDEACGPFADPAEAYRHAVWGGDR